MALKVLIAKKQICIPTHTSLLAVATSDRSCAKSKSSPEILVEQRFVYIYVLCTGIFAIRF